MLCLVQISKINKNLIIMFQSIIIISGNLSFLNWLTIAPCLASFDDASLAWLFPSKRGATKWQVWQLQQEDKFHKTKTKWSEYSFLG